jgi:hypothetical protein
MGYRGVFIELQGCVNRITGVCSSNYRGVFIELQGCVHRITGVCSSNQIVVKRMYNK